ncbi:MAG: hypothetical protein ACD_65C00230G0004 [uncultured bacterium]|nr:MAG: hypothetical protein ACD_65C00230G0004 [uncultured bacterium]
MTNRSSSHQHCLVGNKRPKSKLRVRAAKAKARVGSIARQEAIKTAKKAHLA